jgi:hypothetical protein
MEGRIPVQISHSDLQNKSIGNISGTEKQNSVKYDFVFEIILHFS